MEKLGHTDTVHPSVAIIIVHWKGIDLTKACLRSLQKISYPNYRILLVDNGSRESDGKKLKEEFPEIEPIISEKNLGFTGGNKLGMSHALEQGFDFVLLLNNDTEVEADFLDKLLGAFSQQPQLGMVQPLIFFSADREKIWSAGGRFMPALGISKTIGYGKRKTELDLAKSRQLDWATGCCVLIRAQILREVGLLRDVFFAYFEDVDISLRVREKGWGIALVPDAIIYHAVAGSSKSKSTEGTLSPTVIYLTARNQVFQIKLHVHGFLRKMSAFSYHGVKFSGWFAYFCLRGRFQKAKALLRGLTDGITIDPSIDRLLPPR
ncbi:glycosyltransferase family 2 protein [Mariniradius sediminis]|uniref:Glycosyltransferase family 2 protein n=1 Tax=Mariniradius sediminis TaxID=2909237 RepID=A0ABS9BY78_9BACT|nr:glycosyltransferase family 2 protein [Mariniradius sediminis]MCF1753011.1 glycosyltransferase family 2 protein [Mariniradius sediminis]